MWWTGPLQKSDFFQPASWSAKHNLSSNAIFTMVVSPGEVQHNNPLPDG